MSRLIDDLRFGCRMSRKNPDFAAAVILTMNLGIRANTAVFAARLRPVSGVVEPSRLAHFRAIKVYPRFCRRAGRYIETSS